MSACVPLGLTDEHLDAHAADGTDHALHDFFAGATYLVPQTETGTPAGHLHERVSSRNQAPSRVLDCLLIALCASRSAILDC